MTIKIFLTDEQLDKDTLQAPILMMMMRGRMAKKIVDDGYCYEIDPQDTATLQKAEQFFPLGISENVDFQGVDFWLEVPDTTTDNKVPATWPDATYENEAGDTVTKRFDQYTVVRKGNSGTSLLRLSHFPGLPDENGGFVAQVLVYRTPEEVTRWVDYLAGGDATKVLYGTSYNEWIKNNTDMEI